MSYAIVHYSEIGIKGKNRDFFEKILVKNIKRKLGNVLVYREYGYIIVSAKDFTNLNDVFGISSFLISEKTKLGIESIKKKSLEVLKDKKFETFCVRTSRHNKSFELTSVEIDRQVGQEIVDKMNKKVSLKNPDLTLWIEICDKNVYIGVERISGRKGMPSGVAGSALCLISGGIDSPVASYLSMKRGLHVDFIHFYNNRNESDFEKIKQLAKKLCRFQNNCKLYIVPFSELQKEIIVKIPSRYRMLVYRRFMLRIASRFSDVLILGDNLSQVASQTIENLQAVYSATEKLILSPLTGFDKNEIIELAKNIGTYEISIKPYTDCCSFFVPKHPELRASKEKLDDIEKELDVKTLVEKAVDKVVVLDVC